MDSIADGQFADGQEDTAVEIDVVVTDLGPLLERKDKGEGNVRAEITGRVEEVFRPGSCRFHGVCGRNLFLCRQDGQRAFLFFVDRLRSWCRRCCGCLLGGDGLRRRDAEYLAFLDLRIGQAVGFLDALHGHAKLLGDAVERVVPFDDVFRVTAVGKLFLRGFYGLLRRGRRRDGLCFDGFLIALGGRVGNEDDRVFLQDGQAGVGVVDLLHGHPVGLGDRVERLTLQYDMGVVGLALVLDLVLGDGDGSRDVVLCQRRRYRPRQKQGGQQGCQNAFHHFFVLSVFSSPAKSVRARQKVLQESLRFSRCMASTRLSRRRASAK